MGNVTVEVIGNAQGGGGAYGGGGAQGGGGAYAPDQSRMIEDVRREMQSRGVVMVPGSQTVQQLITQYGQNVQQQQDKEITTRYNKRRDVTHDVYAKRHAEISDQIETERQNRIGQLGHLANDPLWRTQVEREVSERGGRMHDKVDKEYSADLQQIDEEEKAERAETNKELTNAIKELTEYFKHGDGGSYINRLREQQRELIYNRDNASTEGEAMEYNKQLVEVNEKLRRVMTNGVPQQDQRGTGDTILNASRGIEQTLTAMKSGDLGGMVMGTGTTGLALSGMSGGALMKAMGWLGLAVGGIKALTGTAGDTEAFMQLQAMTDVKHSRLLGSAGSLEVDGYNLSDFNIDQQQFAKEVSQRLKQRGGLYDAQYSKSLYEEVIKQIAVERSWGLSEGSVGQAGRFDAYGLESSVAVNQLMNQLVTLGNNGMKQGDFARAQEKLDFQQALMNSYLDRTDKPSYEAANRAVLAMNAVSGITHDSRDQSDYATFQNAIQNPQNDAVRAMIYGVISDIMPETSGRVDLIQRALHNPRNEGRIQQAVIQRLTQQFGGTDTQMGYMVMHQLFPDIADDRLDAYINQIGGGAEAGQILSGEKTVKTSTTVQQQTQQALKKASSVSATEFTQDMQEIKLLLSRILQVLTGAAN
jgi:hypothetical protein